MAIMDRVEGSVADLQCSENDESVPAQIIVIDDEQPGEFRAYLRITHQDSEAANYVDLSAINPTEAQRQAVSMGYAPTHWMFLQAGILNRL